MSDKIKMNIKTYDKINNTIKVLTCITDNLGSAQDIHTNFINAKNLLSSEFIGSLLFDCDNEFIGILSYNGCFYHSEHKYSQLILSAPISH